MKDSEMKNNLCYLEGCEEEINAEFEFFCSSVHKYEFAKSYWPEKRNNLSIAEIQKKLLEMAKTAPKEKGTKQLQVEDFIAS